MADVAKENGVVEKANGVEKKPIKNGVKAVEQNTERTTRKRKNQFGDDDDEYMTVDIWRKRWKRGQTKFHMQKVHPVLEKNFEWLTKGESKRRVFLPLCGKSLDLKWLADKDQVVIGNECSSEGVEQFFDEHNLEYTKQALENIDGDVYKAKDTDISIYCCDYFALKEDIIGTFDCIWDRGSLAAIDPKDRIRYAKVMGPLLKKDGRYLLDSFQVDHGAFIGPPYEIKPEEVKEIYSEYFNVDRKMTRDAMSQWQREWGVSYFIQDVYHITPKVEEEKDKPACAED